MSLFDPQPMGPVPARRPIMRPPDPELEAVVADPTTVDVEVVGEVPSELANPLPITSQPKHRLRTAVGWLLLLPAALSLVGGLIAVGVSEPSDGLMTAPYLMAGGIVLVTIGCAYVIVRRRSDR